MTRPSQWFISIVIPAAGKSSRMRGRDKLTETVGDIPLIQKSVSSAVNSLASEVVVVTRDTQHARRKALNGMDARLVVSDLSKRGLSGSIVAGLSAISTNSTGMLVMLPDMPEIESSDLNYLITAFDGASIIQAATEDGIPGNPVLFPKQFFSEIAALNEDVGAISIVRRNRAVVRQIRLPGQRARIDLDTPEDWLEWRENFERQSNPGAGEEI